MKVYIFTKYKNWVETRKESVWSSAHATRREAVKAMHDEYLSDMNLSYGELDMPYVSERWRLALKRGGCEHDAVERETDFDALYDIFESEVKA